MKESKIEEVVRVINEAKPVILSGGVSISGANEELVKFAKNKNTCYNNLDGYGVISGTNDLFMGMIGMHGTRLPTLQYLNRIFYCNRCKI